VVQGKTDAQIKSHLQVMARPRVNKDLNESDEVFARKNEIAVTLQQKGNKIMSNKLFGCYGQDPLYSEHKWDAILIIIRGYIDMQDILTLMQPVFDPDVDVKIAASLYEMAANPLFYPAIKDVDNAAKEGEIPVSDDDAMDEPSFNIDIFFRDTSTSAGEHPAQQQPMVAADDYEMAAKELTIAKRSSLSMISVRGPDDD
jgi:hypothetical protein